jgi:hypothetical protein
MIDVRKALDGKDGEAAKTKLLASRIAVEAAIHGSSVNCCDVYARCSRELAGWEPAQVESNPCITGWINLFAETCRSKPNRDGMPLACPASGASREAIKPLHLLRLLPQAKEEQSLCQAILGSAYDGRIAPEQVSLQLKHWQDKVEGGHPDRCLARTHLGQTLVMHLLEACLPWYAATTPRTRGVLNALLVPLLEAVFHHPDHAHTVYERYFFGSELADRDSSAFHWLYAGDLRVTEEFKIQNVDVRSKLLKAIREAAEEAPRPSVDKGQEGSVEIAPPRLPPKLAGLANEIAHGRNDSTDVISPREKMTLLSQLSCLIRQLDDSHQQLAGRRGDRPRRRYLPHLRGVDYREAHIVDGRQLGTFTWKPVDPSRELEFIEAVGKRYASGHDVTFLHELFAPGRSGPPLPAWVQDGEVTFLWLLTALTLAQADGQVTEWIQGYGDLRPVVINWNLIVDAESDTDDHKTSIPCGSSLAQFATDRACLFGHTGTARPKAWSLVNFLERAVVSERPQKYSGDNLMSPLIRTCYDALADRDLTLANFQQACGAITSSNEWPRVASIETISRESRLPTFLLEVLLRQGNPTPCSLFFYPITFETHDSLTVPSVFLAGTFAGLEWDCCPSVMVRQNYHLFAALDAVRPIVDFEIGRVLADDQGRFRREATAAAEARENKALAKQRHETIRAVNTDLIALAKLFHNAQVHVSNIETAIDPNWSGLFGDMLATMIAEVYRSNDELQILNPQGSEPKTVKITHVGQRSTARTNLYFRLLYLVRNLLKYDAKIPLGDTNSLFLLEKHSHPNLLNKSPFLRTVCERASMANLDESHALDLLLKLLAVDPVDESRGVHIAQIAAALDLIGPSPSIGSVALSQTTVTGSFNPTTADGMGNLLKILQSDLNDDTRSTAELRVRAKLSGNQRAATFLRALKALSGEALFSSRQDEVHLVKWTLRVGAEGMRDSTFRQIGMTLECKGQFSPNAKDALRKPGESPHSNLRPNVNILSEGIGGTGSVPEFVSTEQEPTDEHPFLIFDYGEANSPHSKWLCLIGAGAS